MTQMKNKYDSSLIYFVILLSADNEIRDYSRSRIVAAASVIDIYLHQCINVAELTFHGPRGFE